jgi:hypothetical protein
MPFIAITEKQSYAAALGMLLVVRFLLSVATAILLVALFLPDHAALSDLLRTLDDLPPTDPVGYTTRMR